MPGLCRLLCRLPLQQVSDVVALCRCAAFRTVPGPCGFELRSQVALPAPASNTLPRWPDRPRSNPERPEKRRQLACRERSGRLIVIRAAKFRPEGVFAASQAHDQLRAGDAIKTQVVEDVTDVGQKRHADVFIESIEKSHCSVSGSPGPVWAKGVGDPAMSKARCTCCACAARQEYWGRDPD